MNNSIDDGDSISDQLRSMLGSGLKCPLCARTEIHEHTPLEIIIYRNGMKYGRRNADALVDNEKLHYAANPISKTPRELGDAAWCPSLENWWKQASDDEKKRAYAEEIASDHWKAKHIRELEDDLENLRELHLHSVGLQKQNSAGD